MRKLLIIPALIFALVASVGCGPTVREGKVYGKRHEAASDTVVLIPIQTGSVCSSTGTSSVCTPIYTSFPFFWHDGEDWVVQLENEKGQTDDVYVTEQVYNSVNVGDHVDWRKDKDVRADDYNNARHRKHA